MRAAAVLLGVDDAKFTDGLPDEDFTDFWGDFESLDIHVRVMTREAFAEQFPEIFNDAEGRWVTSDGHICIDSRVDELYHGDYFLGGDIPFAGGGSVTHFEWNP